jgi:hypothetical protein
MGIFLNTAAYGYYPVVGGVAGCTATSQDPTYTYYLAKAMWDESIPNWTVRVKNNITASMGGANPTRFGAGFFSCNAQYYTASYGGAQQKIGTGTESDRVTSGSIMAYGLPAWVYAFSSESCYVDSYDVLSGGQRCQTLFSTMYGGTFSTATRGFITRDYTKFVSSSVAVGSVWGNQPYKNTCATYNTNGVGNVTFTTCSDGSRTTNASFNGIACAREFQYNFTGGTSTALTITNYYTGSCGTY